MDAKQVEESKRKFESVQQALEYIIQAIGFGKQPVCVCVCVCI